MHIEILLNSHSDFNSEKSFNFSIRNQSLYFLEYVPWQCTYVWFRLSSTKIYSNLAIKQKIKDKTQFAE